MLDLAEFDLWNVVVCIFLSLRFLWPVHRVFPLCLLVVPPTAVFTHCRFVFRGTAVGQTYANQSVKSSLNLSSHLSRTDEVPQPFGVGGTLACPFLITFNYLKY